MLHRLIIQPYECDGEDIYCISKDIKDHKIPKSLENYVDFKNKGIGYKPKLNDQKVNLETDNESSIDKKQEFEQITDEISDTQL